METPTAISSFFFQSFVLASSIFISPTNARLTMSYQETFLSLEQLRNTDDPFGCSFSLPRDIRDNLSAYVSHSIRAYKHHTDIFMATEIKLSRTSQLRFSDHIPHDLHQAMKEAGLTSFGDGIVYSPSSEQVAYLIIDVRQLYLRTQRGAVEGSNLIGEPILLIGGYDCFRFKDVQFPITQALYGVSHDVSEIVKSPNKLKSVPSLLASFIWQTSFTSKPSSRVVPQGVNVSDFLELSISLNPAQSGSLVIKKIKVELEEFLWCLAKGGKASSLWCSRKVTLLEQTSLAKLGICSSALSSHQTSFRLPSSAYSCCIPWVGPTKFTNHISRGYALRVQIEARWNSKDRFTVSSFSEVNIAQVYGNLKDHDPTEYFHLYSSLAQRISLTRIENLPRLLFNRNRFYESDFKGIQRLESFKYESHQIDAVAVKDQVLIITKIDIYVPERPDHIELGNFALPKPPWKTLAIYPANPLDKSSFWSCSKPWKYNFNLLTGLEPDTIMSQSLIKCEVLKSSNILGHSGETHLVGGLFVNLEGVRVKYRFPFNSPIYPFTYRRDLRDFGRHDIHFKGDRTIRISTVARFEKHNVFEQEPGDKIVLPGMWLGQFFRLSLRIPSHESLAHMQMSVEVDKIIRVESVTVYLQETVRRNDTSVRPVHANVHRLLSNRVVVDKPIWWSKLRANPGSQMVEREIPVRLFDCKIPRLGPTYFSNDCYRSYELIVALVIRFGEGLHEFSSSLKIKIAAPKANGIFDRSCTSIKPPPPYGSW